MIVPTVNPETVTPHAEAFQAVVWHLLVSHPTAQGWRRRSGNPTPVKPARVFLDRDGVLNRAVVRDGQALSAGGVDELEILPGVPEALARLKAAGFALVVVTNQPDVARGTTTREAVEAIHARLAAMLPLDEFRVCFHDDGDGCDCRKPKPGLLIGCRPLHDLGRSVMVGDRWRDVEAGRRAGCARLSSSTTTTTRRTPHGPDMRCRVADAKRRTGF